MKYLAHLLLIIIIYTISSFTLIPQDKKRVEMDTVVIYLVDERPSNLLLYTGEYKDTIKMAIFQKNILPIEIDSTQTRTISYTILEKGDSTIMDTYAKKTIIIIRKK